MKKALVAVVMIAALAAAARAIAQKAVPNQDMAGSKQIVYVTCDANEEFVGVAYNDLKGDAMDAVTVICRNLGNNAVRTVENPDLNSRALVEAKCNVPQEYVVAVMYKDRENKDEADAAGVICRDRNSGVERRVEPQDAAGGRQWVEMRGQQGYKSNRGVAYNDRINSDAVDGLTIVTK